MQLAVGREEGGEDLVGMETMPRPVAKKGLPTGYGMPGAP